MSDNFWNSWKNLDFWRLKQCAWKTGLIIPINRDVLHKSEHVATVVTGLEAFGHFIEFYELRSFSFYLLKLKSFLNSPNKPGDNLTFFPYNSADEFCGFFVQFFNHKIFNPVNHVRVYICSISGHSNFSIRRGANAMCGRQDLATNDQLALLNLISPVLKQIFRGTTKTSLKLL